MDTKRPPRLAVNSDGPTAVLRVLSRIYKKRPSLFQIAAEVDTSYSWVWRCAATAQAKGWMKPRKGGGFTITREGEKLLDKANSQMRLPLQ